MIARTAVRLALLALIALPLFGCRRDGPSAAPPPAPDAWAPDAQASALVMPRPTASTDAGASERARWFGHTNYADGLPALRSACTPDGETKDPATAAHPGHRDTVCRGGKVVAVSVTYMDSGPAPPPEWYLARFIAIPKADAATEARVFVAPSELVVSFTRHTRRLSGRAVHVALDLEDVTALTALASSLGLHVQPIREAAAWIRSLGDQRGAGLGLAARITTVPGRSASDVRLTVVNRDAIPLKLTEVPRRAVSLALEVWSKDGRVSPGPPPTPTADLGEVMLAPGETRTYDHSLHTYASDLHGPMIIMPKVEGFGSWSVEALHTTLP